MGFFASLSVRAWASFGLVIALAGFAGWGYFHILDSGVAKCESRHLVADAAAEASAHKEYLAALDWGNQISANLVATQRKLDDTKREYLAYANGIAGNCPGSVGVLSDAAASGTEIPATASKPDVPAAPLSAAVLGANIAENYSRANANAAQLRDLIAWVKETLK